MKFENMHAAYCVVSFYLFCILSLTFDLRQIVSHCSNEKVFHGVISYAVLYFVFVLCSSPGDDGNRIPDAIAPHACIKSSTDYELSLILKEIRFITDQVSQSFVRHSSCVVFHIEHVLRCLFGLGVLVFSFWLHGFVCARIMYRM